MRPILRRTLVVMAVSALGSLAARGQSCQLFVAALDAVGARAENTLLVDRTTMGIPAFAFNGYIMLRRGDTALARLAEPQLRAANKARMPVPGCLADSVGWRTLNDSTLLTFFAANGKRWPGFRERFPQTPKFALLSQPIVFGDSAIIYVAIASDKLAGRGVILRMVRDSAGVWAKQSELQLWNS